MHTVSESAKFANLHHICLTPISPSKNKVTSHIHTHRMKVNSKSLVFHQMTSVWVQGLTNVTGDAFIQYQGTTYTQNSSGPDDQQLTFLCTSLEPFLIITSLTMRARTCQQPHHYLDIMQTRIATHSVLWNHMCASRHSR